MKKTHLGSLIGRVFLVSTLSATKEWKGTDENINEESDYDSISDFISFEEGDLTLFRKNNLWEYFIYFSMSSKIELFLTEDGFMICDGLYFNQSWDYSTEMTLQSSEKIDILFNLSEESFYVFDASLDGITAITPNTSNKTWNDRLNLKLAKGLYAVNRINIACLIDGEEIIFTGIQFISNPILEH